MATQRLAVSTTPLNLATELSLTADVSYIVQVVGSRPLRYADSTTTPSNLEQGHILKPGETWTIQIDSTEHSWVWTNVSGTDIVITEAI